MRKFFAIVAAFLVSLTLSGCLAISLRPWYAARDVIFDPALVGTYVEKQGERNQTLTLTKDGPKGYLMTDITIEGKERQEARYRIRLFQINGRRYLDFSPVSLEWAKMPYQTFPLVEGHFIAQVPSYRKALRFIPVNFGWLEQRLKANPAFLRHERVRYSDAFGAKEESHDDLILTGSTSELRAFLTRYGANPGAFPPTSDKGFIRQ